MYCTVLYVHTKAFMNIEQFVHKPTQNIFLIRTFVKNKAMQRQSKTSSFFWQFLHRLFEDAQFKEHCCGIRSHHKD